MERYEVIRDIGSANFGVAKLVRDVRTEFYAVKIIKRGLKVCTHPNIPSISSVRLLLFTPNKRIGFCFFFSPAWKRGSRSARMS
jgi:hypothetical protein